MSNRIAVRVLVLMGPVVLGVSLLLYATSIHGVGVSHDSVHYINAAANLVEVGRLETNILPGTPHPLTLWPPLYPVLLSMLYPFDQEIVQMASILNAVSLGLYLIGVQLLVLNATKDSVVYAFAAGILTALAPVTLYVFSRAWSETVFLALLVVGMLLLGRYFERQSLESLVMGAGIFALAWLARYVGVASMLTGLFAILLWSSRSKWLRIGDTFLFGAIVSGPMVMLALNHYGLKGEMGSRGIEYQPVLRSWWYQGYAAVASWLIPADSPETVRIIAIVLVALLIVLGVLITVQEFVLWREEKDANKRGWIYPALMVSFSIVYIAMFYGVTAIYDSTMDFGSRELAPIFAPMLVVSAFTIHQLTERYAKHQMGFVGLIIAVSLLFSFQLARTVKWAYVAHDTGLHYNTRAYKESAVIDAARRLPDNVQVYSNNPQLVYFLTERQIGSIGQQTCGPNCSSIESDLDAIGSTGSAILWVPAYDQAQCGVCLETTTLRFGYALTAEDEYFALYQLAPDR